MTQQSPSHNDLYLKMGECLGEVRALRDDVRQSSAGHAKRLDDHTGRIRKLEDHRWKRDGALGLIGGALVLIGWRQIAEWLVSVGHK